MGNFLGGVAAFMIGAGLGAVVVVPVFSMFDKQTPEPVQSPQIVEVHEHTLCDLWRMHSHWNRYSPVMGDDHVKGCLNRS